MAVACTKNSGWVAGGNGINIISGNSLAVTLGMEKKLELEEMEMARVMGMGWSWCWVANSCHF